MEDYKRIGLALSGGGIRAVAFHCGVVRWLAQQHCLEYVTHISSVSGGSLFSGLVFKLSGWKWPSSEQYLNLVEPELRRLLTETSLQYAAAKRLLFPANWKFFLSRANVLSQTLEKYWGVSGYLSCLPEQPVWSINGTTAENGRRFRFKRTSCGDYELGYTNAEDFKVSDAMAVSAAFPIGIGPFVINTDQHIWRKRASWEDSSDTAEEVTLPYRRLHIYDGGVYDNLAIEPLFDPGRRQLKAGVNRVIISDAGSPLKRTSPGNVLNPFRAKRIADIALDQTRALRVRSFVKFIQDNASSGTYIQIGAEARSRITTYRSHNEEQAEKLLTDDWLDNGQVELAANHSTNLRKLTLEAYDRLEQHGYETAKWNDLLFDTEPVAGRRI